MIYRLRDLFRPEYFLKGKLSYHGCIILWNEVSSMEGIPNRIPISRIIIALAIMGVLIPASSALFDYQTEYQFPGLSLPWQSWVYLSLLPVHYLTIMGVPPLPAARYLQITPITPILSIPTTSSPSIVPAPS